MSLTPKQKKLALELYNIGAIKLGAFKLKLHDDDPKAPLSAYYVDLRLLRRFPKAKSMAVDVYQEQLKKIKFDLLADVPTAATPLVSSLSDRLKVGMITPRADKKKHGSGAKIDGFTKKDKGKRVVMVDDLVTQSHSKVEAAATLKKEGLKVKDIVVLIDREQGGKKALAKKGFKLHSAMTMDDLFDAYLKAGKISKKEYQSVKDQAEKLNNYLKK